MWSSLDLTAGKTPVLYDGETQIVAFRSVALYNDEEKSLDHLQGWIYLTNRRICYVDDGHPEENSCFVELDQIISTEYSPRFLRQTPKIRITLKPKTEEHKPTKSWVCEICSFSNALSVKYVPGKSDLPQCENCGVQCWEQPKFIEHAQPSDPKDENMCPRCTFINHKYLRECEICGFVLKTHSKKINLGDTVKIGFMAGGAKEFNDKLRASLSDISTSSDLPVQEVLSPKGTPTNFNLGINRLKVDPPPSEDFFKDCQVLESNAKQIMSLLESRKRLSRDYVPTYTLEGTIIFRDFCRDEKSYLQQLARQISEFLENNGILKKEGGLMTLFDVYAAYNRARGVDPVPASDIDKALQLAPELGMPIKVRNLRSGTKIIESNLWTSSQERLVSWIKRSSKPNGVSILDVGAQFGWSIPVATEELEQSEDVGLLCADKTSAGIRYYINLFTQKV